VNYALRRLLVTPPLLVAVSLIVFALADALPGDAADWRFAKQPEAKEAWRKARGLDDQFLVRWGRYVGGTR
jgi:ABC-type dipeptide/oligopeptide/nickel transport system permease component